MELARAGTNAFLMDTDFNSSPEPDFGSSSLSLTHTNSGSTSQQGSGGTAESMAAAKRRKIRKGTRSCWECKRRKIRCVFDSASPAPDAICIGCQRRGTTCVSQEFPEETSQSGGQFGAGNGVGGAGRARQMGDRIVRVEALVEQLVKKVGSANAATMIGNASAAQARKRGPPGRETTAGSSASADQSGSTAGIMTPDDSSSESAGLFSVIERSGVCGESVGRLLGGLQRLTYTLQDGLEQEGVVAPDGHRPALTTPADANNYLGLLASAPSAGKYAAISKALHALLPSQADALAICSFNGGSAVYLKQLMTRPYNYLTGGGFDSLQVVALIPPPTVHPVLLAKKLLQFAVCLQYISEDQYKTLEMYKLGIDHREAMGRMADAAIQLVTSNDELIGSIDGLECVLTECVFHSDAGNLRRAWLTVRRAMVIAQLMGLHKGAGNHQPLKVIDPLRQRIFPSHIWFRIVFADRFMSMMLGLPQGSLDRSMVDEEALAGDTPLGRLERHSSIVASRILERNESGASLVDSLHETQQIDLELQRIAKLMPTKWWLMPNLVAVQHDWEAVFHATIQMMDQMYHYAMLIHLHLPYMLRFPVNSATMGSSLSSAGPSQAPTPLSAQSPQQQQKLEKQFDGISHSRSEYSKMACVNAARELLARFNSFRSVNTIAFCCRAVDFFALTAAMTLLLAHLDSHKASAAATPSLDEATDFQLNYASSILAHSRLGDRAMLEQTLENMQKVAATSQDVVSRKSEEVLRRLLAIEAEAAEGTAGFTTALATENLGTAQQIDLSLVDGNDPDADGEMEDCMSFEPNRTPGTGGDQSACRVDDAASGTPGQLRMCIPYFGTIKIAREGTISKEPPSAVTSGTKDYVDVEPQLPNDTIHLGNPGQEQLTRYPNFSSSFPPPESQLQAQMGDQTSPNSLADYLNNARQPPQHRSGTFLAEDMPNLHPSQADFNLAFAQQQAAAFANNLGGSVSTGSGAGSSPAAGSGAQFGTNLVDQTVRQNLTYPGLTASTDDWAFQGAELAFFDTLMKGAPGYDGFQGGQGAEGALW
jgi:hypothetical protein